ncbi:ABC transporter ATP-binding protein [Magnetospirillum sulfuroxidans]|uniref:ABC transporter ATP-binding protein n=1 Tax=Magnetospirillum sulfuroxidans TaxID=611300 RepID=A0ABS5I8X8_9PROT|nr:ABC transporter ATP-binding protein [Magnetospirillum sulfuroxidans]MBR9970774.1 ABC transporter ATP-binding protein [Magnetospirillum sulfuroxidans]
MSADFVSVRGLIFEYGSSRALDEVGFDLPAGSVTALVGPNGAGKTTLLRCLAGLERPLAGSIRIDGVDVLEQPRLAHAKLGFQQDFFGVYDQLSVRRNLLHAAAIQGMNEGDMESAAVWAAEAVSLSDRLEQKAGTLSRGLRQRLAIARSMVHRPRLLLMDEPASGLDPEARRELSGLIRTLGAAGMTLVVSSHILAELEDYSTHMLALRDGHSAQVAVLSGTTAAKPRWRLGLVGDAREALAGLHGMAEVSECEIIDGDVEFAFVGEPLARHHLLRHLVDQGVLVTSLAPTGGHLEKLYMGDRA